MTKKKQTNRKVKQRINNICLPMYFAILLAICGICRHFNGGIKPYILKYYGNTSVGIVTSKAERHGKGGFESGISYYFYYETLKYTGCSGMHTDKESGQTLNIRYLPGHPSFNLPEYAVELCTLPIGTEE